MKNYCKTVLALVAVCGMFVFTSCDDDDENGQIYYLNFGNFTQWNADGYWQYCYDPAYNDMLTIDGINFSHTALVSEYDGVTYYSWNGFCPSKVEDAKDYTDGDWVAHQWGSITGGSMIGNGYMLACWDVAEDVTNLSNLKSCVIRQTDGDDMQPIGFYVTNSAWGYWAMVNGSAFSKPFGDGDYCTLHVVAIRNGVAVQQVDVDLARGKDILKTWKFVDLQQMGEVDKLAFYMTSSDTGQWGMNNPAYFCIDNMMFADL